MGTSGSSGERLRLVTPSAFSLPSLTWLITVGVLKKPMATSPDMTARMLIEVKAVLFSDEKPFIFTSGWASPVYIDGRRLISFPRIRRQLMEFAEALSGRLAELSG